MSNSWTGSLLLALALVAAPARAQGRSHEHAHARDGAARAHAHPEPRASLAEILPEREFNRDRHQRVYRMARQIPEVLDGLYCHCDCHDAERGRRSLLSCYEDGMFTRCGICQAQARLAHRLHEEGRSLDEIRAAVDAEYGR